MEVELYRFYLSVNSKMMKEKIGDTRWRVGLHSFLFVLKRECARYVTCCDRVYVSISCRSLTAPLSCACEGDDSCHWRCPERRGACLSTMRLAYFPCCFSGVLLLVCKTVFLARFTILLYGDATRRYYYKLKVKTRDSIFSGSSK
jgi:hypothetical protein